MKLIKKLQYNHVYNGYDKSEIEKLIIDADLNGYMIHCIADLSDVNANDINSSYLVLYDISFSDHCKYNNAIFNTIEKQTEYVINKYKDCTLPQYEFVAFPTK